MAANIGTMTKSTHCGNAASAGLECAMLAAHGFDANPEPFEAFNGYGKMMFGDTFEPRDLLNFGAPWRIVTPGYAVKMFPSQFGTHFAITAGLQLRPKIPDPAQIKSVALKTPVMPYVNRPHPDTGLAGKFSLQYTFASGLLRGEEAIGAAGCAAARAARQERERGAGARPLQELAAAEREAHQGAGWRFREACPDIPQRGGAPICRILSNGRRHRLYEKGQGRLRGGGATSEGPMARGIGEVRQWRSGAFW